MSLCTNCGSKMHGKFCYNCGEKKFEPQKKKISSLFGEAFHFLTHADGLIWRNLKTMVTAPGKMAWDFCNGVKKKYYKPLSFFLLLNILVFIFPNAFMIYKAPLRHQLNSGMLSDYKADIVDNYLQDKGMKYEDFAKTYNKQSSTISKALMVLLIGLSSLFLLLLNMGKNKTYFYFDHFIAATEIICAHLCFMLLMMVPVLCIEFLTAYPEAVLTKLDLVWVILMLICWLTYALFTFRNFYKNNWWRSAVKAVLFTSSFIIIIEAYRFITFWVSYYMAV